MMSRYADINLDESPIVVLGCGHFFTIETLDGHVGLKDVYERDEATGCSTGLIDNAELSASIPKCPNCREPVKQYVTQRYNRLINRAVIDEMSKRFIVNGQQELQQLEESLHDMRSNLEQSRKGVVPESPISVRGNAAHELTMQSINDEIRNRSADPINLMNAVKSFRRRMNFQHHPTWKLYQATMHSIAQSTPLDARLAGVAIDSPSHLADRDRDQCITLGGHLLELKVQSLMLEDNFEVARTAGRMRLNTAMPLSFSGGSPVTKTDKFLKDCRKLIDDCTSECLPKLAVEASLYYARIAQLFASSGLVKDTDRIKAMNHRNTAKTLLAKAKELCEHSFRDRDALLQAIVNTASMLDNDFYEEVSKEELEAIKKAMVSGRGGIATHSGHWYKCVNGHPVSYPGYKLWEVDTNFSQFAIGECGMPMERARCPECGQPVGGQRHTAIAGVTRATEMEG